MGIKKMWRYYEREELINTPSFKDGIDAKTEFRYRSEGVKFIRFIGAKMDLGYNTIATGVVFFHRFYMAHSFKDFPRYVTACSSLFLAGKAEETPKRCKDLVEAAKSLLTEDVFKTFGDNAKEEVMTFEKVLLKTINFEFSVEHPYKFLLKYGKYLRGDKAKVEKVVQRAWNFMNDR
ncbi:cyclin-K-like [Belonocnema kinseyi]|uniref:cyclin-K-like n=1 Tax=Belonocnema kinseyi TaxID=2817044 RepID=UPI00143CD326|nr:cyclin-K-like [Belonocnema kinseyi]